MPRTWARCAMAILCVVTLLAACGKTTSDPAQTADAPIRITGIPDENPSQLQRKHAPLVAHLKERLGRDVTYVPVTDYGAAVQALAAGTVDFAWLGGFTHVQSRHLAEVEPLVMRAVDREFKSVIVGNVAAGVKTVADAKGKPFAFGSKSSTSGHLMPRHFLSTTFDIDAERDFPGAPVFSGAHDATVKIVASGRVAAGAVNQQVWNRMLKAGDVDPAQVTAVWTTPPYVDYVWTARTAIPAEVREQFAKAFTDLKADDPAHAELLALQDAKRYVPAAASDFDAIEAVALKTGLLKPRQ